MKHSRGDPARKHTPRPSPHRSSQAHPTHPPTHLNPHKQCTPCFRCSTHPRPPPTCTHTPHRIPPSRSPAPCRHSPPLSSHLPLPYLFQPRAPLPPSQAPRLPSRLPPPGIPPHLSPHPTSPLQHPACTPCPTPCPSHSTPRRSSSLPRHHQPPFPFFPTRLPAAALLPVASSFTGTASPPTNLTTSPRTRFSRSGTRSPM